MIIANLIFALIGLIIALILLLVFVGIIAVAIVAIGYVKEEVYEEQEKGIFHKIAYKIGMF